MAICPAVHVTCVDAVSPLLLAAIFPKPVPMHANCPPEAICVTPASREVHVATLVTSAVVPSLNVAVKCSCVVSPGTSVGKDGVKDREVGRTGDAKREPPDPHPFVMKSVRVMRVANPIALKE